MGVRGPGGAGAEAWSDRAGGVAGRGGLARPLRRPGARPGTTRRGTREQRDRLTGPLPEAAQRRRMAAATEGLLMNEASAGSVRTGSQDAGRPPLDFQEHLAALEAKGLLVRIDRPSNKDTERQPLVRWQFQGGLPEDERRAFLFTNVTDGAGRRYDIPVAVGALAASPAIYAVGMGRPVEEIGAAWLNAIAHPIPPVTVSSPRCQEVVIKGEHLRRPDGGLKRLPVPISTPGFDAAPYLTATLCITRDPETGIANMGTYRAALKATDRLGVRMSARVGGAGGYLHWKKYRARK